MRFIQVMAGVLLLTILLALAIAVKSYLFPKTPMVNAFIAHTLIVSLAGTAWMITRSTLKPEVVRNELLAAEKPLYPIILGIYFSTSAIVALSQWLSFNPFQSLVMLAMLYAFAMNSLPTQGIEIFKSKAFKYLYLPCLIFSSLGVAIGIVVHAT